MNAIVIPSELESDPLELDPIELDPRPCGDCGCTIDRHERVDTAEGPEFFCIDYLPDEMTIPELERRVELRRLEEIAAIMTRLDAMDDPSTRLPPRAESKPYRPASSTVGAFWHVVSLSDPMRFKAWLADHPKDASFLLKLLEGK